MGHKPWDRPWKRVAKAKGRRAWKGEVTRDTADDAIPSEQEDDRE